VGYVKIKAHGESKRCNSAMTDARGINNKVGGTRYVIKMIMPKLVEPGKVKRDRAYPESTPANRDTIVEATAMHSVFQAQRVKRVL
jgi:hypothetical protein